MSEPDFTGRVAVVTGGSRGIGAGIAMALAKCGAQVVVNGRDTHALAHVVHAIQARGGQALAVVADVTDEDALATLRLQALRWASFERTLSAERARNFIKRLDDFEDVEAETRALDYARGHADFEPALRFLMEWPALVDASRLIQDRADDIKVDPDDAERWAAKLRIRQPLAAHTLLRKAAAAAFRRRDFKTCDRLTTEADSIDI